MKSHKSKRHLSASERRAFQAIDRDICSARSCSKPNNRSGAPSSFMIKRALSFPDEQLQVKVNEVREKLLTSKSTSLDILSLSVVSPSDGYKIRQNMESQGLEVDIASLDEFEGSTLHLPVVARFGRALIMGAKRNLAGRRFAAIAIGSPESHHLIEERQSVFDHLSQPIPSRFSIPHISFALTKDQNCVESMFEIITEAKLGGAEIILEPAQIMPVNFVPYTASARA